MVPSLLLRNNKDVLLKNINKLKNQFAIYEKLFLVIHVQKIDKIFDYFVLQSICLIDTVSSQKPKLKTLKCKYTFGSRAFSFSCKVTLRKIKLKKFISLLNLIIFSEIKRRHIIIAGSVDSILKKNKFSFSFAISNTNVFLKLDEFYFKWNYPIIFTFVGKEEDKEIAIKKQNIDSFHNLDSSVLSLPFYSV